jgi:hypothetical protein
MKEKYFDYIQEEKRLIEEKRSRLEEHNASKARKALLKIRESGFCRFFIVRWKRFKHLHPKARNSLRSLLTF